MKGGTILAMHIDEDNKEVDRENTHDISIIDVGFKCLCLSSRRWGDNDYSGNPTTR